MAQKGAPIITSNSRGEEYTRVTFRPDLSKFGMDIIDDDLEALLKKRVYDLAGCIRDIKVYLNDEKIKVKSFKQYVELYTSSKEINGLPTKPPILHEIVNDRWEIAFTLSDGQFQQVIFVDLRMSANLD
jgi:DNA topoisomerase-2